MRIRCPSCEANLPAPEDVVGKRVKCPKCGEAFIAADDEWETKTAVQAGAPGSAPAAPPPLPRGEDPPRKSRRELDDDEDDRPRRRRREEDEEEDEEEQDGRPRRLRRSEAKYLASRPGYLLGAAAGFTLLTVLINMLLTLMAGPPPGILNEGAARAGQYVGACCGLLIYGTALFFVSYASWGLWQLRMMPMVIIGLVVAVLAAGFLLLGVVINIILVVTDNEAVAQTGMVSVFMTIFLNTVAAILNLSGVAWAVMVLCNGEVRRHFRSGW